LRHNLLMHPELPGLNSFWGLIEQITSITQIWKVMSWLRAQAEAVAAEHMGSAVRSWAIEAPDFAFQIDHERQESLAEQRGHFAVLLVLFDPAAPLERVRALAKSEHEFRRAGLRIIAIPSRDLQAPGVHWRGIEAPIIANFDRQISSAYAVLAPMDFERNDLSEAKHAEFLIDRRGYIRARWTSHDGGARLQAPNLTEQLSLLDRIPPRPLLGQDGGHVH